MSNDIKAWARRLRQDGIYLEFNDLFLFSQRRGFDLEVLVWKEGLVRVYAMLTQDET